MEALSWTTSDQLTIYGAHWPVENPKAVMALVHGLGEHVHRYERFANYFTQHDFAVIGSDHRGHGRSEGKRGHTPRYELFLEEVDLLLQKVDTLYPDRPVFLFGHSMGGNIVLNYCLERQAKIQGLIVSAPWIDLGQTPPAFLVALGRLMAKIYPAFSQPNGLDASHIVTVPEEVDAYKNDPLVHGMVSSGTGIGVMNASEKIRNFSGKFPVPLLVYHGEKDPIVKVEGSRSLVNRFKGDIEFKEWPDLYHETHYEKEWKEVLNVSLNWMQSKL